jgi:hypothetical protein
MVNPLQGAVFQEFVEGIVSEAEEPIGGELDEVAFTLDVDLTELETVFGGEFTSSVKGVIGGKGEGDVGEGDDAAGPGETEDFGGVVFGEGRFAAVDDGRAVGFFVGDEAEVEREGIVLEEAGGEGAGIGDEDGGFDAGAIDVEEHEFVAVGCKMVEEVIDDGIGGDGGVDGGEEDEGAGE